MSSEEEEYPYKDEEFAPWIRVKVSDNNKICEKNVKRSNVVRRIKDGKKDLITNKFNQVPKGSNRYIRPASQSNSRSKTAIGYSQRRLYLQIYDDKENHSLESTLGGT